MLSCWINVVHYNGCHMYAVSVLMYSRYTSVYWLLKPKHMHSAIACFIMLWSVTLLFLVN